VGEEKRYKGGKASPTGSPSSIGGSLRKSARKGGRKGSSWQRKEKENPARGERLIPHYRLEEERSKKKLPGCPAVEEGQPGPDEEGGEQGGSLMKTGLSHLYSG